MRKFPNIAALALFLVSSCKDTDNIISIGGTASAFYHAVEYHNGVKRTGNDGDWDYDGINDLYILCNDGNVMVASSRTAPKSGIDP